MKIAMLNEKYVKYFIAYYIVILLFAAYNIYAYFFGNKDFQQLIATGLPLNAYFFISIGTALTITAVSISFILIIYKKNLPRVHLIYPVYKVIIFDLIWLGAIPFAITFFIADPNLSITILEKSTKADILFYLFDISFSSFMLLNLWKNQGITIEMNH